MWMDILGVAAGLLTLGVGISGATALGAAGLKISDRFNGAGGYVFWMGYAVAVVAPAFFAAFGLAALVGAWVCSL